MVVTSWVAARRRYGPVDVGNDHGQDKLCGGQLRPEGKLAQVWGLMTSQPMTIRLGDEFDDALRDAVRTALVDMAVVPGEVSWGVGGSQEIETLQAVIDGERVIIEAETYAGLTVMGAEMTVRRVAAAVRAVLARARK
jgi:hypothetical protein